MAYRFINCWTAILLATFFSVTAIPGSCGIYVSNADTKENIVRNLVIEAETGLVWQRNEADSMPWKEAISYCETLKIEGYAKWRLPDVKELRSLVNYGRTKPAADLEKYPEVHLSDYWTSTTYVSSNYSYCVNFTTGTVGYCNKNQKKYVRCVKNLEKSGKTKRKKIQKAGSS